MNWFVENWSFVGVLVGAGLALLIEHVIGPQFKRSLKKWTGRK